MPGPQHGLHQRLKRLWRGLDNPRAATFKDAKASFGLDRVAVSCPARLNRLLLAFALARAWLALLALPEVGALRRGAVTWAAWRREVQAQGPVSIVTLALEFLARFQRVPAPALPRPV